MADHQRHAYLRHGRLLSLFGEDNLDDVSGSMTVSNADNAVSNNSVVDNSSSSESADWSTRKSILFAEAIAVTAIVIPIVFCFLYRASKSGHLPTTTLSSARSSSGINNATTTTTANGTTIATTEVLVSDRALRFLQQQQQQQQQQQPDEDIEQEQQNNDDDNQPPPTLIQRLTNLPSTLLSILLYPFHIIDEGVNAWSTTNADITFLRSVMERLEEDRVAQLEDVEERGERLKLAFSKGDVVWEIAEEHFIPPPESYSLSPTPPDMIVECIDGTEHTATAASSSANENKEGLADEEEVEERELGEEKLSEEELKQQDDNNGDDATAMNTANDAAAIDASNATVIDNIIEEEGSDKNEEEAINGEDKNNEEEGNEEQHQLSPLIMDETNDTDRPLPLLDEGDDFGGEPFLANSPSVTTLFSVVNTSSVDSSTPLCGLTLSTPPRSSSTPPRLSSPLDAGETPAFLYLPHRRSRSRANTNETNSSNMPSLTPSSSSSSSNHHLSSQSLESIVSSSSTNNSTKMDNSADSNKAPSPEEEDLLKSVPNNCAICLSEYVSGDTIVTSCNPMCPHVFHQECIVEWLVKMQVGAPCPCCRRTFVELSPSRPTPAAADSGSRDSSNNNNSVRRTTSPEEEERRREELRRTIQLGIRRGRAFDFSVISLR